MLFTLNLVFAKKTKPFDLPESGCPSEAGDLWTNRRWSVDYDNDFSAL